MDLGGLTGKTSVRSGVWRIDQPATWIAQTNTTMETMAKHGFNLHGHCTYVHGYLRVQQPG